MNLRTERACRDLVAVREEAQGDWQPHHWSVFDASVDVLAEELGRIDRRNEAKPAPRPKAKRPKPDPPELVAGKAVVEDRSGGFCEVRVPGICEHQQTETHHRAGRKGQGCHDAGLLVAVCGLGNVTGCHGAIHQHSDWARFHGLLYAPLDGSVPAYLGCSLSCEVDHRPIAGPA